METLLAKNGNVVVRTYRFSGDPAGSLPWGPTMNDRPSARVMSRAAPMFLEASLACEPLTVTSSPIFRELGLKPLRISEVGVLASKPQFTTLPLFSVTSMKNHECGFSNLISVSTPCTVTGLSASNAAAKA